MYIYVCIIEVIYWVTFKIQHVFLLARVTINIHYLFWCIKIFDFWMDDIFSFWKLKPNLIRSIKEYI